MSTYPLVSVVTPVYNAEPYLAECIESVIRQTYPNWQYVIVNNHSTDGTLDIAKRYASLDSRISVINNESFVGLIENHNIAVKSISPESRYCKVVSADDWLFPECLEQMVELAELHPSVAIVGSYQLSGSSTTWKVRWDAIPYPSTVVPGKEICRFHLLSDTSVFGNPTSSLYRSDIVSQDRPFYPHSLPHADKSACYEHLQNNDYGFVHQVLSFERIHENSVSFGCRQLESNYSAALRDLITYGPAYLRKPEYHARMEGLMAAYYRCLARGIVKRRRKSYWIYHRKELAELGRPIVSLALFKAVVAEFSNLLLSPKETIQKALGRRRDGSTAVHQTWSPGRSSTSRTIIAPDRKAPNRMENPAVSADVVLKG